MSELIDRAARALVLAESGGDDFDAFDAEMQDTIRANVRAVLAAIREPTESMVIAAQLGDAWAMDDPEGMWREMIDAALMDLDPT